MVYEIVVIYIVFVKDFFEFVFFFFVGCVVEKFREVDEVVIIVVIEGKYLVV